MTNTKKIESITTAIYSTINGKRTRLFERKKYNSESFPTDGLIDFIDFINSELELCDCEQLDRYSYTATTVQEATDIIAKVLKEYRLQYRYTVDYAIDYAD